jgi:thymidylate kinase
MKLLAIEGCDRVGKDLLINEIIKRYSNTVKRHWAFPKGNSNEEKTQYQKDTFLREFELHKYLNVRIENDSLMIWNRSHIGEMVYGSLYRDSKPEEWVMNLEKDFSFHTDKSIYLVYLYADAEFIIKEDDGNSYSKKLSDKSQELISFASAIHSSSIIKKLSIKVNHNDKYINQEIILNQVLNFLNT